jgi:hypothetical protein
LRIAFAGSFEVNSWIMKQCLLVTMLAIGGMVLSSCASNQPNTAPTTDTTPGRATIQEQPTQLPARPR